MKRLLLSGQFILLSVYAWSQAVTIKRVELAGEKIVVIYDLEDSNPNNEYLLNLYTSKDNFAKSVEAVAGDVGMDIKPGANKRIEWFIIKDYGGYKGKLSLEVRGKVYVPFARIQNFNPKATYRRGKNYEIKWKPGNTNPINIELYKAGQRVIGEVNHPNNGSYEMFIPTHAKTGGDYKLKFSDTRNPDEVFYTQEFSIKPKIPLLLKIAPVAILGTVVFLLTSKTKSPGEEEGPGMIDPNFPPDNP